MSNSTLQQDSDQFIYRELAAAFIRGRLHVAQELGYEQLVEIASQHHLRLGKFKRTQGLPRVQKVIGILRSLQPNTLTDFGSGRGVFLWPLLDTFPKVQVTAVEIDPVRVRDLQAVRAGGIQNLFVEQQDVCAHPGLAKTDVVTVLEVLEHLENPARAAELAVQTANQWVIASVPSKEDNNPEHIHLFTGDSLTDLFKQAGAIEVSISYVRGHILALAKVSQ